MSSNPNAGPLAGAATLSAEQAARLLGISRRTLYAYVSRGLLTSMADPGGVRTRRYPAAAVRRLAALRAARRDPVMGARAAARGALAWGEPVLDTAITLVSGGRFYYRGHDALLLAEQAAASPASTAQAGGQFERVADLLLRGTLPASARLDAADPAVSSVLARVGEISIGRPLTPVRTALAALPLLGALDPTEADLRPPTVAAAGRRILSLLSAAACDRDVPGRADTRPKNASVAGGLAACWVGGSPAEIAAFTRLFDAALVLVADHELNPSAFAARVAASVGASPYTAVSAGLAAIEGAGHAGESVRVSELLAEAESLAGTLPDADPAASEALAETMRMMIARRVRTGDGIPGFGHALYPDGDPRGRVLLALARRALADIPAPARTLRVADAFAAAVYERTDRRPTIDYALAALCRAAAAPAHAPLTLFAMGRTAGLIAHVIEQYAMGRMLRPRGQYVGPPPLDIAG